MTTVKNSCFTEKPQIRPQVTAIIKAGTHYPYVRAVRNDRTYGRSLRPARVNFWHP